MFRWRATSFLIRPSYNGRADAAASAIFGTVVFLLLAPGAVARMPWWITHRRPPLLWISGFQILAVECAMGNTSCSLKLICGRALACLNFFVQEDTIQLFDQLYELFWVLLVAGCFGKLAPICNLGLH
jgi:hypothetical protein